jgi:hypothetical protein
MRRRKRRDDHLDARISQRSIDLYKLGKAMLAQGFRDDSREFYEVSLGLHRALDLRPWMLEIFDFELCIVTPPYPPHAGYELVRELHRRLVAASA